MALAVVLRQLLLLIPNAESWCAPVQLSVLLCALFCGWGWGLCCGLSAPLLCWLICGSPSAAVLPMLLAECAIVGLAGGFLVEKLSSGGKSNALPVSAFSALFAGRILGGILGGLLFAPGLGSIIFWCLGYAAVGLPGFILSLVLLPGLYSALKNLI